MQPLNLNLNKVDTSMPLLVEGKYPVVIKNASVVEAKKWPGCGNLKVDYVTKDPARDAKTGAEIAAGYPLTRYYPVPPYGDGANDDQFLRALTLLQLAVCNKPNKPEEVAALPPFDDAFVASMPGKVVMASVKTSKPKEGEDDGYGPKSEINNVTAIG